MNLSRLSDYRVNFGEVTWQLLRKGWSSTLPRERGRTAKDGRCGSLGGARRVAMRPLVVGAPVAPHVVGLSMRGSELIQARLRDAKSDVDSVALGERAVDFVVNVLVRTDHESLMETDSVSARILVGLVHSALRCARIASLKSKGEAPVGAA